ncbi:Site-specific DNA recombinase [Flavobacterium gillisiae]|jgi:DNA invertase Pin-like site-specific DNA recombinase|uniref:Site-specific DNA recombinase n=1 Tax=Flavobacterium gillisiae TaxID=150146 RepID=A0A1H4C6I1_9FLAO|nr:recombinase family protein [Flavobacterium gillisiae]SEA55969.1 Site-specific DNA recombinase [Flavobacterium gillisiae]
MTNLAIYVRVSTTNQSYSRQIEDIEKYIATIYDNKKTNIDVYAENISGFKNSKDRPQLTRFLTKVAAEPEYYKCLYVTELSRVGRNPIEARTIVTNLLEQNIDVCITSTNGGSNFLNADGSIDKTKFAVLGLLMDFAQIEVDVFKSRTASGLKEKVLKGGTTGGLLQPYGYSKDEHKKLVIDKEEAKIIDSIFEQYQQGLGMNHIAQQLNKNNTPTRTNKAFEGKEYKGKNADAVKWTANQIYVILTNTIYYGVRVFNKRKKKNKDGILEDNSESFDSPDVAIITKERYDKCTEIRLNKKGNGRNIHTKNVILLQYLTTCGVCGRNYTHRVGDTNQNYICSSRVIFGLKSCGNLGVNIDLVDSSIYNILCNSQTVLKYLSDTDSIKKDLENKINLLESSIPFLEKELKTNELKIDRLLDSMLDDTITKERFNSKSTELSSISTNLTTQLEIQTKQLISNKKSLKNLTKVNLDDSVLKQAKSDRNKLKSIYKQIIKDVTITGLNYQFIRLDITLQINGSPIAGTLKVVVSRKGLRKKPYKYQYQDEYLAPFEPSEEIDDYYERIGNNTKYQYKNNNEYNAIISDFKIITDNIINIKESYSKNPLSDSNV